MDVIHTLGATTESKDSDPHPKHRNKNALAALVLIRAASFKTVATTAAPPVLGAALAFSEGFLKWKIFLLIMLCSALIHAIGGMLSNAYATRIIEPGEYFDQDKDSLQRRDLRITAGVLTFVLMGFGMIIALLTSKAVVSIGFFSLLFAYLAAGGPFPIPISPTGRVFVYMLFGVSGAIGSYFAITSHIDWHITILSAASGLMCGAIYVAAMLDSARQRPNEPGKAKPIDIEEVENSKFIGVTVIFIYLIIILLALSLSHWSLLFSFVSLPFAVKLLLRSSDRAENSGGACISLANGLLISTSLALGIAFIVF